MEELSLKVNARLETLPEGLRDHVNRSRRVGEELAAKHGIDAHRVDLGVAIHDLARALSADELLEQARGLGLDAHPVAWRNPVLLHGAVAAAWARSDDIVDPGVLEAAEWHTIGRRGMGDVAKAVFLADKLDPSKIESYPGLAEVRGLAERSLDGAILEYLSQSLVYHLGRGSLIHPETLELRNELLVELGEQKTS